MYISGIHLFSSVHSHIAGLSRCLPHQLRSGWSLQNPGSTTPLAPQLTPSQEHFQVASVQFHPRWGVSSPLSSGLTADPGLERQRACWWRTGRTRGQVFWPGGLACHSPGLGGSLFPLFLINNSSPIKPWSLFSRLPFSGFTVNIQGNLYQVL